MQTLTEESRAGCQDRVNELTQQDIDHLSQFAEHRLAVTGLAPAAGEDVAAQALATLVRVMESDQGGRRPRLEDVKDKDTFSNWLRGAVCSIISTMISSQQFRAPHLTWDDAVALGEPAAEQSPAEEAELSELAQTLFGWLRERSPRMHQSTIDAWQQVYPHADRVPSVKNRRKYSHEVRKLARTIITELDAIP